ncbi:YjbF family lipoprotein [Jannaschia sp. LMIT008]|uniref:YjbF family lipoprotein n=1 Tax=Jannaschia maritima TaxID=3032585 RepID=UPI002811C8AC|nr:YjbF family lipoprotein [Jannaschia sp. LMIT008]
MSVRRILGPAGLALVLALASGCDRIVDAVPSVGALLERADGPPPAAAILATLSRPGLAPFGSEQLVAVLERRDVAAVLLPGPTVAGTTTWIAADATTVSVRHDGLVVATRGLAPDLMRADLSEIASALDAGAGPATRVHRHLDGLDREVVAAYACRIRTEGPGTVTILGRAIPALHLTERCANGRVRFRNDYWRDRTGRYVRSRQWIGEEAGHIRLEYIGP